MCLGARTRPTSLPPKLCVGEAGEGTDVGPAPSLWQGRQPPKFFFSETPSFAGAGENTSTLSMPRALELESHGPYASDPSLNAASYPGILSSVFALTGDHLAS